jgi:energy-coupling factor transporter ATP-binding protein EcfA2
MAHIARIFVEPFRCIPRLDVTLGEAGEGSWRHLILTGPNGSGKTTLIKALQEGLDQRFGRSSDVLQARIFDEELARIASAEAGARAEPNSASTPRVAITLTKPWGEVRREGRFLIAWRGAQEVLRVRGVRAIDHDALKGANPPDVGLFLQYLVNLKAEQAFLLQEGDVAGAKRVERFFERLTSLVRRVLQDERAEVSFVRADYNFFIQRSDGLRFDFNTLADGHGAAFAVIARIALAIDRIHATPKDPTLQPDGVVFIDEVEAHLHPSMQREILPILTEFFPTLQFVVATHSPAVIASIPRATVVDLGSRAVVASEDLAGVRYGAILKGYFGVEDDVDVDTHDKLDHLRAMSRRGFATPDERHAFDALADELSQRSADLSAEVWLLRNQLGERAAS